jgi:hypothetical protein
MRSGSELLFVLALAAACGGGEGEQAGAPEAEAPAAETAREAAPSDACKALSRSDIEQAVGNPVLEGEHEASSEVCDWETEDPDDTGVMLVLRPKGGIHEQTLCADLPNSTEGERIPGLGDVAVWKFSAMGSLFNSGDLEACGARGFVSISINGNGDEAKLKEAATTLVRKVLGG